MDVKGELQSLLRQGLFLRGARFVLSKAWLSALIFDEEQAAADLSSGSSAGCPSDSNQEFTSTAMAWKKRPLAGQAGVESLQCTG